MSNQPDRQNEEHCFTVLDTPYVSNGQSVSFFALQDVHSKRIWGTLYFSEKGAIIQYDDIAKSLFLAWGLLLHNPPWCPPERLLFYKEMPSAFATQLKEELLENGVKIEIGFAPETNEKMLRRWRAIMVRVKRRIPCSEEYFSPELLINLVTEEIAAYNASLGAAATEEGSPE